MNFFKTTKDFDRKEKNHLIPIGIIAFVLSYVIYLKFSAIKLVEIQIIKSYTNSVN